MADGPRRLITAYERAAASTSARPIHIQWPLRDTHVSGGVDMGELSFSDLRAWHQQVFLASNRELTVRDEDVRLTFCLQHAEERAVERARPGVRDHEGRV